LMSIRILRNVKEIPLLFAALWISHDYFCR
jgi:hypothetical protein